MSLPVAPAACAAGCARPRRRAAGRPALNAGTALGRAKEEADSGSIMMRAHASVTVPCAAFHFCPSSMDRTPVRTVISLCVFRLLAGDGDSAAHAIPSVPGTARTDGDVDRQEPRLDPSLSLASLSGPLAAVAPSLPAFGPAQGNGPYRRNRASTPMWRALALNLNLSQQESSESLITAVALIAGLVAAAASAARGSCGTAFPLTDLQRRAWAAS